MPAGLLEVTVVEGRNLRDQDTVGHNDAFVEVYIDKKYKQRTKTIKNTNNPAWNEKFTFNLQAKDDLISFKLYDDDVGDRDAIGKCKVNLAKVFDDGKFDEWVKLPALFGLSSNGEVHVIMNFTVNKYFSLMKPNDRRFSSLCCRHLRIFRFDSDERKFIISLISTDFFFFVKHLKTRIKKFSNPNKDIFIINAF